MKNGGLKKILMGMAVLVVIGVLVFVKDPEAQKQETMDSIYDHILLPYAQQAVDSCTEFNEVLKHTQAGSREANLTASFKQLVLSWKKVQGSYILGEYNDDMKDTPVFIDNFHVGKGDLFAQLERIVNSDKPASSALYKTSYQTINALEYFLFSQDEVSERQLELARFVTENVCFQLQNIYQAYQEFHPQIISDPKLMLTNFMDKLSNLTFQIKDWRIGDVMGYTLKYKDTGASYNRSEYPYSHLSSQAMQALFEVQEALILEQDYLNLGDLIELSGATKQLETTRDLLKQATQDVFVLSDDDLQTPNEKVKKAYDSVNNLQKDYYNVLIPALDVSQKILEADGD
ncbi:imelysin family protein [Basilea psittacipulmonis]|uniref:Imelysin-like domain-containing protein n=1 Tax=Basilea psittacipulmonis DSM 24701 TaxID=1072685 RepID=A0A077DFG6_9BURK|nr:imelysin family protein [Basilea psittacipulmonis]AIL32901.1 hypothetical protein IX83_05825 [Basilea psittacipulmonis DSM 24701]